MPILRIAASARSDMAALLTWTDTTFGPIVRQRYQRLLTTALQDLAADPYCVGSNSRPELGEAIRTYHLFHCRQRSRHLDTIIHRPRHFVLYRISLDNVVGIGRVLHDAMEAERHLPRSYEE